MLSHSHSETVHGQKCFYYKAMKEKTQKSTTDVLTSYDNKLLWRSYIIWQVYFCLGGKRRGNTEVKGFGEELWKHIIMLVFTLRCHKDTEDSECSNGSNHCLSQHNAISQNFENNIIKISTSPKDAGAWTSLLVLMNWCVVKTSCCLAHRNMTFNQFHAEVYR